MYAKENFNFEKNWNLKYSSNKTHKNKNYPQKIFLNY